MSGEISWVEVPAADTAKARTFYGSRFGWGTSETNISSFEPDSCSSPGSHSTA